MGKRQKEFKKAKKETSSSVATLEKKPSNETVITVVAVGGGGGNVLTTLEAPTHKKFQTVALNTDSQALERTNANSKILLGTRRTKGLGAQGNPALGYEAALESKSEIEESVKDSDLVFVVAGLGAGTGTGASIVVSEAAKKAGATVVAIVTTPFDWEGTSRKSFAEKGIAELYKVADSVVVLHNNDLKKYLQSMNEPLNISKAFSGMDTVISANIHSIADLILIPGLINLDFSDYQLVLEAGQEATIAFGEASGENRAIAATQKALQNAFLNFELKEAKGIILNVTGGPDFTFDDLDKVSQVIHDSLPSYEETFDTSNPFAESGTSVSANIVVGSIVKDELPEGKVSVTILAVK